MVIEWKGIPVTIDPEVERTEKRKWQLKKDFAEARVQTQRMLEGQEVDEDPIEKCRKIVDEAIDIGTQSIAQFVRDGQWLSMSKI